LYPFNGDSAFDRFGTWEEVTTYEMLDRITHKSAVSGNDAINEQPSASIIIRIKDRFIARRNTRRCWFQGFRVGLDAW
jgi:hypothetical protein